MKNNNHKSICSLLLATFLFPLLMMAQEQNSALSDPQIASIAVVANQIDIDYAHLARDRSSNQQVLGLANTMATDHQMVIDRAVELVTKLGVTPEDNAVSQQLQKEAEKTRERLKEVSEEEFDQAYVDNEVTYHQKVIAAVEGLLVPQAQNPELKALLEEVLPILQGHLEHAQMVQKNL